MYFDTKCSLLPRGQAALRQLLSPGTICRGAVRVSLPPKEESSLREGRSLSQGWCWSQGPQTEAAFGRGMLRVVNAGEGTDSSHHQFCFSASTAQNLFYHHTLSFFFSSFKKEFKAAQCSCLAQPVAVLWLLAPLWGDGAPLPCAGGLSPSSRTRQG